MKIEMRTKPIKKRTYASVVVGEVFTFVDLKSEYSKHNFLMSQSRVVDLSDYDTILDSDVWAWFIEAEEFEEDWEKEDFENYFGNTEVKVYDATLIIED